jgi:hypothetical protein
MNLHSTFSPHIILDQTSLFPFFWSLESIHHRDEDHGRDEGVLNVLSRTESDQHEREESENLTIEGSLKILWNFDRVTREQTLVQDNESEEDGLRLNDGFSWGTERSKETVEFWHL